MNTQSGIASKDLQGFRNLGGLAVMIALALFGQPAFAQTFTLQNGADMQMQNGGVLNLGNATTLNENGGRITDGSVTATRLLNAPSAQNVAGLGAILTSSEDLDQTVITRTHEMETVIGQQAINRFFDISPANNSGLDATLTFTYHDSELSGQPEDQLVLFRSEDDGATYTHEGFDSRDGSTNTITLSGLDALSRWTAAAGSTLNLTLTGQEGWRMLSSPIDGLTYDGMLGDLWTQGVPGADFDGGDPNVYTWDETFPETCEEGVENCLGWDPVSNLADAIPAGTGFLMFVFSDDDFDEDAEGFDKPLTLSGAPHPVAGGGISPTINDNGEGWTLVGNPYAQPVSFDALDKTDLTDVAYVYDTNLTEDDVDDGELGPTNDNAGGWRTTDGNFGDLDGIIAPGQGFFVQNDGAAGSLTFTEESRVSGGEFYGKEKKRRDFVRLEVQGESLYNSAWIRFSEEGSLERTEGEALELQPLDSHYAIMGARKTDGTLMDIAHYPLGEQDLEIPLAVEATQSGSFTIHATDLDLPAGMELYLHDTQTAESMPIGEDFEYRFELTEGTEGGVLRAKDPTPQKILAIGAVGPSKAKTTGTDRFLITTSPSADGPASELPDEIDLGQNYPNPFNPTTVISYQLPVNSEVRLEVYDMLGRRVATLVDEQVAAGTHQVSFDGSNLSSGVYLYRLTANGPNGTNQIFTKKLTLIK